MEIAFKNALRYANLQKLAKCIGTKPIIYSNIQNTFKVSYTNLKISPARWQDCYATKLQQLATI